MMSVDLRPLEERLAALKKRREVNDDLSRIAQSMLDKAEAQRSDVGGAFRAANMLREGSKDFIFYLGGGDPDGVLKDYQKIFKDIWAALKRLDLRPSFGDQQDSESGAEIGEAMAVLDLHKILFDESIDGKDQLVSTTRKALEDLWYQMGDPKADPRLAELVANEDKVAEAANMRGEEEPIFHQMSLPYQTWLAGICDAPGELSKFVSKDNLNADLEEGFGLSYTDRKKLMIRYIHIARTTYEFLGSFETCYPAVINNSQRKGWFNTFRGTLGRVSGVVDARLKALEEMSNRDAQNEEFLAKLQKLLDKYEEVLAELRQAKTSA